MLDRIYFKIWPQERRFFRAAVKEWLRTNLRYLPELLDATARICSDLSPPNVQAINNVLFGTSHPVKYDPFFVYLSLPSWFLKSIDADFRRRGKWYVYQKMWDAGISVPTTRILKWIYHLAPEQKRRIIEMVERRERLRASALREVGRLEQDFILELEETRDLEVYRKYAELFKGCKPINLLVYVIDSTHRLSLIDEAAICAIAEEANVAVPKFTDFVIEKLREKELL